MEYEAENSANGTYKRPSPSALSPRPVVTIVVLGALIVANGFIDFIPLKDPFFRGAASVWCLVDVAIVLALFLWADRTLAANPNGVLWTDWSASFRVVVVCLLALPLMVMLRPRINWGDADWVMMILQKDQYSANPRWMNSINLMVLSYRPFRGWLTPPAFACGLYCCFGLICGLSVRNLVWRWCPVARENLAFLVIAVFSFATFALMCGYLEIYGWTQLGVLIWLWAADRLIRGDRGMPAFLYWGIVGWSLFLYMGNLPLVAFAAIPYAFRLYSIGRTSLAAAGRSIASAVVGASGALYLAAAFLGGNAFLGPGKAFSTLWRYATYGTSVTFEQDATSWYFSIAEMLSVERLIDFVEVWLIFGLGPIFLFGFVIASVLGHEGRLRKIKVVLSDGMLLTLTCYSGFILCTMWAKRPVMGFKDWDMFTYAVLPMSLCGIRATILLVKPGPARLTALRAVAAVSVAWFGFTFGVMNPLRQSWSKLPENKLHETIRNYSLTKPIPMDAHLRRVWMEVQKIEL